VTSNPSPAYIQRVSNVFLDNGSGIRGDMKSVISAILTDPEARAGDDPGAAPNLNFGHLREPILFMANLLRGLNATLGPSSAIDKYAANLGEELFNPPSVFSYFSPLYRLEDGERAPEFQIYSAQTAADRADVVNTILYGALDKSTTIDLTPFLPSGGNVGSMVDYIDYVFLHQAMSNDLREAAISAAGAATGAKAQAQAALYVVLTSSEYQIVQ
jgi:hypothetical protein